MISIIIPVFNEEKTIEKTLKHISKLKGDFETIVVDGNSTDNTVKIIKRHKAKLFKSKKGRAFQMNTGAKKAKGDILLFLHADTKLPKNTYKETTKTLNSKNIVAGGFHKRFDKKNLILKYIFFTTTLWFILLRDIYGDQTLFLTKKTFNKIKGFPNIKLMENVEISKKLRKIGKLKLSKYCVTTSARRFGKRPGRTFLFMMFLYTLYKFGFSADKLARWYKDVR